MSHWHAASDLADELAKTETVRKVSKTLVSRIAGVATVAATGNPLAGSAASTAVGVAHDGSSGFRSASDRLAGVAVVTLASAAAPALLGGWLIYEGAKKLLKND